MAPNLHLQSDRGEAKFSIGLRLSRRDEFILDLAHYSRRGSLIYVGKKVIFCYNSAMSLLRYLVIMAMATLFSWAAWIVVLFYIDPFTTGTLGLFSFYTSLFCGILGLLSLLGFAVRLALHRQEPPFRFIGVSLRQALWLAIVVVLSLFLIAEKLWNIWTSLLLFVFLIFLEIFFLLKTRSRNAGGTRTT